MRPLPLLLAALLLAGGCSAPAAPAAPSPPQAQAAAAAEFGGTDLAWVELMIPMDEQLLPLLDLVRDRAADPALVSLAGDLRGVYDGELPRLRALSDQAGLPKDNPHKGHKMPGLVDADTLSALRSDSGAGFEQRAVACLREHLAQLANLATSEIANGTSPTVKSLAGQVQQTRTAATSRLPVFTDMSATP
ncbi:DUF305 domain-containing protein [Dactylosporangium darangshiense]|uniref:DUF305 domain-containing protein n=1 Tax=Dactylosporangium darangshiense TaxID=579108 RepID=A0ABP8DRE7_9ACTN